MGDETGVNSLLTTGLRVKLEKIAKDEGFVNPLIRLGEGAKSGDGYIGVVFRVYIEEQHKGSQKPTQALVVKCLPTIPQENQIFPTAIFFRMEKIFYDVMQPEFIKFQKDRGITLLSPIAPRCFSATNEVILEDMRPLGYTMKEGNFIMDLPHITLFLKELGRMHAVSLAMRDQEPEIYERITQNLEEPFVVKVPSKIMQERFDIAVEMTKEEFKKRVKGPHKERYVEMLEKFLDAGYYKKITDCLDTSRSEPYSVINHGDCWSNNALYKYDTPDKKVPSGVLLLDFQLVRNTSPVIDVLYTIFIGTNKALRDKHYKELLATYYDSLAEFVRKLGSDPEKMFPFSAFEGHMKKFSLFIAGMIIHETPVFVYKAEDEPQSDVASPVDPAFSLTHTNMDACWTHVCDVIGDLMDLGYMD